MSEGAECAIKTFQQEKPSMVTRANNSALCTFKMAARVALMFSPQRNGKHGRHKCGFGN